MPHADDEQRRRAERARRMALFRYELIQDVIDPALSSRQRGRLVRELAERAHQGPFGEQVRVSRQTIDRWIRWWRAGGFEALVPTPARVSARTPAEVLALAAALKREHPQRTAAQVARILRAQSGWAPSERTLQRHFVRLELDRTVPATPLVFGRFEADRPNELWTGDALHGPVIAGRKTILFCFIDDHSRAVMGARFGYHEDTVRLAAALRPALAARGVPEQVYVDNGSPFVDSWLLRACAVLGIRLVHSTPRRPQGRGKIERFFRHVRTAFLPHLTSEILADLAQLNRVFWAWLEAEYHQTPHGGLDGQTPLDRFLHDQALIRPAPEHLEAWLRMKVTRRVGRDRTVHLDGRLYEAPDGYAGETVEVLYDPYDPARPVHFRRKGQSAELSLRRLDLATNATLRRLERNPEPAQDAPTTGISYLELIAKKFYQEEPR